MRTSTPILVFSRTIRPGHIKTRLIPVLGAEQAAALGLRMAEHALRRARAASIGPVELWLDGTDQKLQRLARRFGCVVKMQSPGDLGHRMRHALDAALQYSNAVILIGTDCPDLSPQVLRDASVLLRQKNCVLGPAADGGYVLIGLTTPQPALFEDIIWGHRTVLSETRTRLTKLALDWAELPALPDVDTPSDWSVLLRRHTGLFAGIEIPDSKGGSQ